MNRRDVGAVSLESPVPAVAKQANPADVDVDAFWHIHIDASERRENGRGGRYAAEALLTALMPLASWSVAEEHGRESGLPSLRHRRHQGERRGCPVHAVGTLWVWHPCRISQAAAQRRHVSPVTAAPQERRNTSSRGRAVRYPAQDQLQLNGTAVRLRPDAIRTRPQRSRRHGQRISLSPRVVRTPRIGRREPQAGRESRRPGGATPAAVPILPLSGPRPHQPGSGSENAQVALRQHSESTEVWARSGAWPPRAQTGKARLLSALQ
jgi:hypothetical protein